MTSNIANTFQTPNSFVDNVGYLLTSEEFMVLIFVTRHILGWHEKLLTRSGAVSLSMLENGFTSAKGNAYHGCGLSRACILRALDNLVLYGILEKIDNPTPDGQRWHIPDDDSGFKYGELETRLQTRQHQNRERIRTARQQAQVNQSAGLSDRPPESRSVPQTDAGLSDRRNQTHDQTHDSKDSFASDANASTGQGEIPSLDQALKDAYEALRKARDLDTIDYSQWYAYRDALASALNAAWDDEPKQIAICRTVIAAPQNLIAKPEASAAAPITLSLDGETWTAIGSVSANDKRVGRSGYFVMDKVRQRLFLKRFSRQRDALDSGLFKSLAVAEVDSAQVMLSGGGQYLVLAPEKPLRQISALQRAIGNCLLQQTTDDAVRANLALVNTRQRLILTTEGYAETAMPTPEESQTLAAGLCGPFLTWYREAQKAEHDIVSAAPPSGPDTLPKWYGRWVSLGKPAHYAKSANGNGRTKAASKTCPDCHGSGLVDYARENGVERRAVPGDLIRYAGPCPTCHPEEQPHVAA